MNIKILDCANNMSQNEILELETKIRVPLPGTYKDFLMQYNGGKPEPNEFIYVENSHEKYAILQRFLGISERSYSNLYGYIETFKEHEERIPSNLIPIAHDPGGNLICISVMGEDIGKVYFWERDGEADIDGGEVADYSNVYWIADSFTDFIAGITKF
jgi:SMI1-KNR4 cell-wall